MKTRKLVVSGALVAGVLLTGCTSHNVRDSGSFQATPPTPTQKNVAYSGSQTCLFNTQDGDYSVFVLIKATASCSEWAKSLAEDGNYWTPVGTGGPAGAELCSLSSAGMTLSVWNYSSIAEPVGNGVAQSACQSMEQDGWTPKIP